MLENKLVSIEKELQQVKKDNTTLTRYINARTKKEEDRRKVEAQKKIEKEVCKKAEEDQSSKDVQTWRK
jgi:hypothetical protein